MCRQEPLQTPVGRQEMPAGGREVGSLLAMMASP